MKPHFGFLSFCLLLAALLLSSPLHADFTIDVHINSAENPTLTFGEVDEIANVRSFPHPPFSGMFGVADVCFAGPVDAPEWYDRLAEDVKTANNANQWILVAKSNARLQFKSEAMPTYLKIIYNDIKSGEKKVTPLTNNLAFSVKTGGVYTITRDDTVDPAENPDQDSNKFMAKGEPGDITITLPEDFAPTTMKISFRAGIGVLAHFGEPDNEEFLDINPRALTLADVDWIITVTNAVKYDWDASYTELTVTLSGTRGVGDVEVSMTPNRSSAPPIQTTITTFGNSDPITNIIDWILQKFGTLDFDGDQVITANDVMYLYNWVNFGMPRADNPDDEWFSADMLGGFIANPDPAKLNNAWEYFQSNTDELIFDNGAILTADNVMYLYNYVNLGCPSANNPDDEWFTADMLGGFIANPDSEKLQNAMETLQEYAEQ